jgi:putative transposase
LWELAICGVVRGKPWRTTAPAEPDHCTADLVNRDFTAPASSRLWVADLIQAAARVCYVGFVVNT